MNLLKNFYPRMLKAMPEAKEQIEKLRQCEQTVRKLRKLCRAVELREREKRLLLREQKLLIRIGHRRHAGKGAAGPPAAPN